MPDVEASSGTPRKIFEMDVTDFMWYVEGPVEVVDQTGRIKQKTYSSQLDIELY
jgi:hypothetical protein